MSLENWFKIFEQAKYERLSTISVAHIYNLRHSVGYRRQRIEYTETRPTPVTIGVRRKPTPEGRPGFLRIDTVHQGDLDEVKGVYHINAVAEVTQWQMVGAVERVSEAWLLPILQDILEQFPFRVLSFHSDNGLVEAKNGAVIPAHGYLHIQSEHANAIHNFYRDHLNPYLNFHRPCGQPELINDAKGKQKLVYKQ